MIATAWDNAAQSCLSRINQGLTLRDYFAAAALGTMSLAPNYIEGPCNFAAAARSYELADAMLAEREKSNPA